ncbi:MAG: hypothetical protein M5U15_14760 [Kiritimatiellae bacterium]|nr:hypothetical protein [Kiritimatiellia bacterium]MCZ7593311.1 hypothetical protein [Kiritimatiellia bacterium]
MKESNTHPQAAVGIAALLTALCLVSFASPSPRSEEPTAIDAEQSDAIP